MAADRRPRCTRWNNAGREIPNRSLPPAEPADGRDRQCPPKPAATGLSGARLVALPPASPHADDPPPGAIFRRKGQTKIATDPRPKPDFLTKSIIATVPTRPARSVGYRFFTDDNLEKSFPQLGADLVSIDCRRLMCEDKE
jgi:hypothetical protein